MKKWTMLMMGMALALLLAGCGVSSSGDASDDLVFVSQSNARIVSVVLRGDHFEQGAQNADNSPLARDNSLGFEVAGYPVTVTVYSGPNGQGAPLATCTVEEAPAEGERWYVAARDSGGDIRLEIGTQWPEDAG